MLLTAEPVSPVSPPVARAASPGRARVAYILAASHSGSTLLAMQLGGHPQACTAGELKGVRGDPETYRCSCGARVKECEFWRRVTAGMGQRGFDFSIAQAGTNIQQTGDPLLRRLLRPLHRGPLLEAVRESGLFALPQWHAHRRRIQARNSALVKTLLQVSGADLIVDSSKVGLRLKYLLRNPDLEVRVLRLVRDGRGVALTHTNPAEFADAANPELRSGGTGGPGHRGLSMADAAELWRRSNEEADRVTATLRPAQWLEVRYEQLCQRPAETLRAIGDFLELPPQPVGESFRARQPQHVVGNGMRFDTHAEVRLDERWKTHLTAGDLEIFNRVAGELNRKHGYS